MAGPISPLREPSPLKVATNISHWLKVQYRWFKNYNLQKSVFAQLLDFQKLLYYSFTLYYCAICWIFSIPCGCYCAICWIFFDTMRVSNSFDPDRARHLGPNYLQRLSADNKMSGMIWVQTVCKVYQQTTKVAP